MSNLEIPVLFTDEHWQQCLTSFLDETHQREGRARFIDARTILRLFFLGRDPGTISRDIVELFSHSDTIHGKPNLHTVNRRRATLKAFYDHAHAQGIFQADNPACPLEKPRIPHLFNNPDWQACLVAWVSQLRSDETKSSYTNILIRFFRDSSRLPDTYTRQECEFFIRSAQSSKKHNGGEPVKPSAQTINARLATLSSFYKYAEGYQIMGDDKHLHQLLQTPPPTKGIKSEVVGPAHRLLTESDIKRLFSQIPSTSAVGIRDRAMFTCYLYLGRRNRELRLHWGDIQPYTFTEQGVSREGYRYRYHAKGKGQEQWLYAEMPQEVYDQIIWLLTATGRLDDIQPGDGIFVSHRMSPDGRLVGFSKEPLASGTIRHILKKYARAASLDESACVHAFRHFNAQMRYRIGQGLLEISAAMGHSSCAVTHQYLSSLITGADPGAPLLAARLGPLIEVL